MTSNTDSRRRALSHWLEELGYKNVSMLSASSDASVRRYFRFVDGGQSFIAVDTPQPQKENQSFIDLGQTLSQAGLHTPHIYESDPKNGWMLLEDFGSQTFVQALDKTDDRSKLYSDALKITGELQESPLLQVTSESLPIYDECTVQRELAIFTEWCLERHLGIKLERKELSDWQLLCSTLTRTFDEQPQSFVHRDFHSRNLMLLENGSLGLLDFQGAVRGPITYDWVSLLRDCYVALPPAEVEKHLISTYERSSQTGLCKQHSFAEINRWFDYTGLQRHLKAIGIFCRLKHRDSKNTYIADIPRTFAYVLAVVEQRDELAPLRQLIERHNLEEKLC